VQRVYTTNPRKPNSSNRKVCRVGCSDGRRHISAIRGVTHTLKKFSKVVVSGGGFRDTPGAHTKLIFGLGNFNRATITGQRRSVFGIKRRLWFITKFAIIAFLLGGADASFFFVGLIGARLVAAALLL